MSGTTKIEWADVVWNPLRGCSRVSAGCMRCYAERQAQRFSGVGQAYDGLVMQGRWTGHVRLVEEALDLPLRWRTPRRIFVTSMSDAHHDQVPDEWRDKILAVIALTPHHIYQWLTKRASAMLAYFSDPETPYRVQMAMDALGVDARHDEAALTWPLPNVWLGVSVENQAAADERIPLLLHTPAAVRWVSYEPALEAVNFARWLPRRCGCPEQFMGRDCPACHGTGRIRLPGEALLDWLVIGGESGPGARVLDLAWARQAIAQCRAAGVPVFVKQLGTRPLSYREGPSPHAPPYLLLRDRKGADPAEWPEDLRVREWPQ